METSLQSALSRIQDIEARIASLSSPQPPNFSPTAAGGPGLVPPPGVSTPGTGLGAQPFNVMLAQAGGAIRLQRMSGGAGPFAPEIEGLIARCSRENNLQPELVRAVIQQESGGNPRSVSAVGAQGLMQLMPATGRAYGVTDAFDPAQNIAAGTRHLGGLLREFGGDVSKALAAYNAGAGAVRKYGGVPPFPETQNYVKRILGMVEAAAPK